VGPLGENILKIDIPPQVANSDVPNPSKTCHTFKILHKDKEKKPCDKLHISTVPYDGS